MLSAAGAVATRSVPVAQFWRICVGAHHFCLNCDCRVSQESLVVPTGKRRASHPHLS